jgi:adenylate kinase
MSKIIVLMGAPGAGKGTQARLLQERRGLPQISTGDMFRALLKTETPLAEELRPILSAGTLVPDGLTIRIVRERTAQSDCRGGYVLDGFPRTTAQADALAGVLAEHDRELTAAVLIDVPDEVVVERISGRGQGRSDDNPETVRERLRVYHDATVPLIDYYDERGLLRRVDGRGDPDDVHAQVRDALS